MSEDKGPSFVTREPVVAAGGGTVGVVGLAYAVMELAEAYDWQHFTGAQSKALIGIVVIVAALGSSLLAAQKVTPEHEVQRRVLEAWIAEPPPNSVAIPQMLPTVKTNEFGGMDWTGGFTPAPGTETAPLSPGDQLVADAIAVQHLAVPIPEDPTRPEV